MKMALNESPDGTTKNEIHLIITNKKKSVQDVAVSNRFSINSDNWLLRAKIIINVKGERIKMILASSGKDELLSKTRNLQI